MFREMMFSSTIAGVLAAIVLTITQALWVTPLILEAETYENAEPAVDAPSHDHATAAHQVSTAAHDHAAATEEHHHDAEAWAPEDGWQRTLSTTMANSVMGIGFALMLTGLYALRRPRNIQQGAAWGLAGYVAFFVAPSLGLPPELPGTEAADLMERQAWWLTTAMSTAIALALLFLQQRWVLRLLAVGLLVAPHVLGAPHPAIEHSLAPEALQMDFRVATLVVNGAFWVVLGALSAVVFQRLTRQG